MTPAARDAAAIEILDQWLVGAPVEQALTRWARGSRFAGSKDRAAIRDRVFDALRQARSAQALGGGDLTGRALILGVMRAQGQQPDGWGEGPYAPAAMSDEERALFAQPVADLPPADLPPDVPAWMVPLFQERKHGHEGQERQERQERQEKRGTEILNALRQRAPVHLRVNLSRMTRQAAQTQLRQDGIDTQLHASVDTALIVTANPRKIRTSAAFAHGLVELQDAHSQALVHQLHAHLPGPQRVLDYCAGGGGKSLALADLGHDVTAHDVDPRRMADLPERARRAGRTIPCLSTPALSKASQGGWPVVFVDAPCSGSGSWRRTPEAKWALTQTRLAELVALQREVLQKASQFVAAGGVMAYATCSVFACENDAQVRWFCETQKGWDCVEERHYIPSADGDGFYEAVLKRKTPES